MGYILIYVYVQRYETDIYFDRGVLILFFSVGFFGVFGWLSFDVCTHAHTHAHARVIPPNHFNLQLLYIYICNPFTVPLNKVFSLNTLRKGIISLHLSKYINKSISIDHCNLFIYNRLKTFKTVYTMQNNISFNLVQLEFYTVSKKRLELYCKCEN